MRFKRTYLNKEHYYSIGIDEETGENVMEVVITWVCWYSVYFRLTDEEHERFQQDQEALSATVLERCSQK
jgi:hypothetical protein